MTTLLNLATNPPPLEYLRRYKPMSDSLLDASLADKHDTVGNMTSIKISALYL